MYVVFPDPVLSLPIREECAERTSYHEKNPKIEAKLSRVVREQCCITIETDTLETW